jgi:hypothetical protein
MAEPGKAFDKNETLQVIGKRLADLTAEKAALVKAAEAIENGENNEQTFNTLLLGMWSSGSANAYNDCRKLLNGSQGDIIRYVTCIEKAIR